MPGIVRVSGICPYDFSHMPTAAPLSLPPALHKLLPLALHGACTGAWRQRGELLFATGKRPSQMFYVVRGEVVLQRVGAQGDTIVLQRVGQGFIGEASLQSKTYHCDAMVVADSEVIAIAIDALRQALANDATFAMDWIAMLNQELKRLRAHNERLALKGVRARLLHLIETEGHAGRLPVRAGLKSVAAELAVSLEALYRTLAQLERSGVVQRGEGWLSRS